MKLIVGLCFYATLLLFTFYCLYYIDCGEHSISTWTLVLYYSTKFLDA